MASLDTPSRPHMVQHTVDEIRSITICKICLKPFYEPFILVCGHTFCYGCLRSWFCGDDNRRKKKSCPECRTAVNTTPTPNYSLRDLAHMFFDRPELLPEDETVEEHNKGKLEEARLLASDRQKGSLFQGVFAKLEGSFRRRAMLDLDDGVERCPVCGWEIEEDGLCNHCGWEDDEHSFSDDQASISANAFDSEEESILAPANRRHGNNHGIDLQSDEDMQDHHVIDIVSDGDETGSGMYGHGTPLPYGGDYDEDDEDDMDDFIDDDDHPDETEHILHGTAWPNMSRSFQRQHRGALSGNGDIHNFEESSDFETSALDSVDTDHTIPSDEDEDDSDEDEEHISNGLRQNRGFDAAQSLDTFPDGQSVDYDQETNYDESSEEDRRSPTPVVAQQTQPVKRRTLQIIDSDDEEDETRNIENEAPEERFHETNTDQFEEAENTSDHGEPAFDSDDSTPPQSAVDRRNRLQIHRAAQARRSNSNEHHANRPARDDHRTHHSQSRHSEAVTSTGRARGRPHRPSTRVC